MCTAFAQGNIGKAVMLAGSEHFNEIKDEAVRLLKNIDTMELGDLVEAVKRISAYKIEITDYLEEKLDSLAAKYDFITDRRGMGLMQGLVFDRPVAPLINAALENGLILINAGTNIIRFVPPLVITDADVDEMIEILDSCLKTFQEQNA